MSMRSNSWDEELENAIAKAGEELMSMRLDDLVALLDQESDSDVYHFFMEQERGDTGFCQTPD